MFGAGDGKERRASQWLPEMVEIQFYFPEELAGTANTTGSTSAAAPHLGLAADPACRKQGRGTHSGRAQGVVHSDPSLCWRGSLDDLLYYVDSETSPLIIRMRYAIQALQNHPLSSQDNLSPINQRQQQQEQQEQQQQQQQQQPQQQQPWSATIRQLQHSPLEQAAAAARGTVLHMDYALSREYDDSLRSGQALVTLMNGYGDEARQCLLGEDLLRTILLCDQLGFRHYVRLCAPSLEEKYRIFGLDLTQCSE